MEPVSSLPTVSVIMAVYSTQLHILKQSVDSILTQDYRDLEFIIVCDDPSNLDLIKALQDYSFKHPKMLVLYNNANIGFPQSINRAILHARGHYIARMDADDIALPHRISAQVSFMNNNPQIGICGMQAEAIDFNGNIIGYIKKPCNPHAIKMYILHATPVVHPTYFVRRSVYKRLLGYKDFAPGQDYEFLIRAIRNHFAIANLSTIGLKYRISPHSLSRGSLRRTLTTAQHLRKLSKNASSCLDLSIFKRKYSDTFFLKAIYSLRNYFLACSRRNKLPLKIIYICLAAMASCLHIDVLHDSLHGLQGLYIIKYRDNM